jgi:hypothetical protein
MGIKAVGGLVVGALFLLTGGLPGWGQPFAGGSYVFDFESQGLAVWDISGTYDEEMGGVDTTFTIDVDSQGKITGSGDASAYMMGVHVVGDLLLGGNILRAGAVTRVNLSIKMTGTASYQGKSYKFNVTEKVTAAVDPDVNLLTGTVSIKANVAGRSASEKGDFEMPFDSSIDGSWTVPINVTVDSKGKVQGTGEIWISGGRSFDSAVNGVYSAKSGLASLTIKSLEQASKGVSVKITARPQGQGMAVNTVSGKLLGQKVMKK